ncbi:uncharacterized protein PADG_11943 [Paracoccidioides brasiliensis Pb18]|uniref:Uncharacterized protein n=1 Tax=Paracoccidioides brasiliensis (strain Pb18) TaxID=502780 RepID=A0A0A0HX26_PARBD|nr:uncharacterized protein PADG_11943 [Paracoccidioides brasiliensis Pb18]KGM91965.1 hypothetical protein PADG_11943 [Paracoccidioides brasiliensis Pb18]
MAWFILLYFGVLLDRAGRDYMWWVGSAGRDLVEEVSDILLYSPIAKIPEGPAGITKDKKRILRSNLHATHRALFFHSAHTMFKLTDALPIILLVLNSLFTTGRTSSQGDVSGTLSRQWIPINDRIVRKTSSFDCPGPQASCNKVAGSEMLPGRSV